MFCVSCPNIIHILHGVLVGAAGSHFCPKNSHKRRVSLSQIQILFVAPFSDPKIEFSVNLTNYILNSNSN